MALVALAVDVLDSVRTSGSADVEVPPLLTANGAGKRVRLDPELVEQVEPELAALRRSLLGGNGASPTTASNGLSSAAYALRNLLEIVLDERLEL